MYLPQAHACGFFVWPEKVGFKIQAISLKVEKNSDFFTAFFIFLRIDK